MNPYYTGVGSRKTPNDVLHLMTTIATRLARFGYVLRSGAAIGADSAFELGAGRQCEIFLTKDATEQAAVIAAQFHPTWYRLGDYVKKLHARNTFQVLGRDLNSPSGFLICWTPDGCISHETRSKETGGTGTAISIADHWRVPIHNLAIPSHREAWVRWLSAVAAGL